MIYFINIKTASRLVKNEPQMRRFSEEMGPLSTNLLLAHLRLESSIEEVVFVSIPDSCHPRWYCRPFRIVRSGRSTAHLQARYSQLSAYAATRSSQAPLTLNGSRA
jgi:hypothetical protein